jgi:hypothetical protein
MQARVRVDGIDCRIVRDSSSPDCREPAMEVTAFAQPDETLLRPHDSIQRHNLRERAVLRQDLCSSGSP